MEGRIQSPKVRKLNGLFMPKKTDLLKKKFCFENNIEKERKKSW
jgi:hypothetical protein